jgi:hypothetical protein
MLSICYQPLINLHNDGIASHFCRLLVLFVTPVVSDEDLIGSISSLYEILKRC